MRDRTVLIVGAADEVGQAIAVRCATGGGSLVLVDSDARALAEVARQVRQAGSTAKVIAVDPTDPASADAAMKVVSKECGPVHVLVNNVDRRDGVPVSEGRVEAWDGSLRANLAPVISFCLKVVPAMREQKYGRIVNVGSLEYLGTPNQSNYCASKAAVFGLTRSLALELAGEGITVNQVLKGDMGQAAGSTEEERARAARIPVDRLGSPADIAHAVAFLASASSKYVTGQNLIVCGGKSLYSSMSV
jgi:3-oxoacyl-[acyl-carrier protein] reductase/2-[hydroxy(phenyl)methyl]-succinyl-CoA dehydrogenase BbsC subunit